MAATERTTDAQKRQRTSSPGVPAETNMSERRLSLAGRDVATFKKHLWQFCRTERFARTMMDYHFAERGEKKAVIHNPKAACESGLYIEKAGIVTNDPDWVVVSIDGAGKITQTPTECKVERMAIGTTGFQKAQVAQLIDLEGEIYLVRDQWVDIFTTDFLREVKAERPIVRLRYGMAGTEDNEGYDWQRKELDKLAKDGKVKRQVYGPKTLALVEHLHKDPVFFQRM